MRAMKFLSALAFLATFPLSAHAEVGSSVSLKPILLYAIPMSALVLLCLVIMLKKSEPEDIDFSEPEPEVVPQSQPTQRIIKKAKPKLPPIRLVPEIKSLPVIQSALKFIKPQEPETVEDANDKLFPFKARSPFTEADEIILSERNSFFEGFSPLDDITGEAKEKEISTVKEPDFADYDKLIKVFENKLKIAHKIKSDEVTPPEIIDAFSITDYSGFSLVKYGEKTSIVGNISDKVFILKTFKNEELVDDNLFIEFCSQTPEYFIYAVIFNNFKSLIKVTPTDIYLCGDAN